MTARVGTGLQPCAFLSIVLHLREGRTGLEAGATCRVDLKKPGHVYEHVHVDDSEDALDKLCSLDAPTADIEQMLAEIDSGRRSSGK